MSKKGGYKIIDFLNNDIESQSVIPGIYNSILENKEKQFILSGIVFDEVLIDDAAVVSIGLDSDDKIIILANALKITITEDDEVTAESFNLLTEIDTLTDDIVDIKNDINKITPTLSGQIAGGTSLCKYFASGDMVIVSVNVNIIEAITTESPILTGLPEAKESGIGFMTTSDGKTARMLIYANEQSIKADGNITNTGYYNGILIYKKK